MTVLDAAIQATRKSARVFVAFEERAGGEVGMTDANAMAFPHRAPHYHVTMVAKWSDPTDDQTSETSVRNPKPVFYLISQQLVLPADLDLPFVRLSEPTP